MNTQMRRIDELDKLWVLTDRPDLRLDCIDYILENDKLSVPKAIIMYLSSLCADAISSEDLDRMAYEDWKRMADDMKEEL